MTHKVKNRGIFFPIQVRKNSVEKVERKKKSLAFHFHSHQMSAPIYFGEPSVKTVEQLRYLNNACFPITYSQGFYDVKKK